MALEAIARRLRIALYSQSISDHSKSLGHTLYGESVDFKAAFGIAPKAEFQTHLSECPIWFSKITSKELDYSRRWSFKA